MIHITKLEESLPLFKALSSDIRIEIINILTQYKQLNMNELSEKLNLTNGAVTMHIKKLEECGIIKTTNLAGKHGLQKICSIHEDKFVIDIGVKDSAN